MLDITYGLESINQTVCVEELILLLTCYQMLPQLITIDYAIALITCIKEDRTYVIVTSNGWYVTSKL